jgi:uncharacterized protein (UPF0248 family)
MIALMQPLQDLLHRIRWDAEFAKGEFALGYNDRVAGHERIVPFASIGLDSETDTFSVHDEEGFVVRIPLHRVRTVYKNGTAIWRRPGPRAGVHRDT